SADESRPLAAAIDRCDAPESRHYAAIQPEPNDSSFNIPDPTAVTPSYDSPRHRGGSANLRGKP
ncbi:hypothetical protein LPJ56_001348, partial [Coemansia sp. RSA 2599]